MGALMGRCVLVVEDDDDGAELLVTMFTRAGADVRRASTTMEALRVLASWVPDVLLLDIRLPDLDGCDLLATIRYSPRLLGTPAVAISAHPLDTSSHRPATGPGFAAYVAKPIDPHALVQLVVDLIG
jgi:CheY-like chemotaxis protein